MNVLGLHVNAWQGDAWGSVLRGNPKVLKVLNTAGDVPKVAEWRARRPDGLLVYREVFENGYPDSDVQGRVDRLCQGAAKLLPYGVVVETPWNECMQEDTLLAMYSDRTCQAVDILRRRGFGKISVGHFSVTWPKASGVNLFAPALRAADYFSLHEYSAPTMRTHLGANCLHYRSLYNALPADCRKPLIISECGIDWGVLGVPLSGRRTTGIAPGSYVEELRWYAQELARDSYVVGATIFCCGCWSDWETFNVAGVAEVETLLREDLQADPVAPTPPDAEDTTMLNVGPGFRDWQRERPDLIGEFVEDERYHQASADDPRRVSFCRTTNGVLTWYGPSDNDMTFKARGGKVYRRANGGSV